MKKLISLLLICALFLTACLNTTNSPDRKEFVESDKLDTTEESTIETKHLDEGYKNFIENTDETSFDIAIEKNICDIEINGLNDEALIEYVEDNIYSNLVEKIDSTDYFVENIEAVYYPKEYVDTLLSNSRTNVYFGYTAKELDEQFQGTKYVFTLDNYGQTVVVPMEILNEDVYIKAMEDVLIGSGVILICITASVVTSTTAPAISMIFAASATTGSKFALESGGIAFAAAAILKGYETESFEQAIKAGVQAAGEGYKWGAISGTIVGGGKEVITLKGATLNGLTMNEAVKIQKESGFPLELIKQFKSYKEYEVYKEAGLYTKMINGKLALIRNIDPDFVSDLPNGDKVTNLLRMQKGYAPIDPGTGKAYQLHHINQDSNGTLAILIEAEHQGNSLILNLFGKESEIDRTAFDKIKKNFWKKYAASLL